MTKKKPLPMCDCCGEEEALTFVPMCGYCMDVNDVGLPLKEAKA